MGKRVSVRTLTGSGVPGARFTDTVGVLTSWTEGVLRVTRRDGSVVSLDASALVAGKVVPAAAARPRGLPAADVAELTAVAVRGWPALETTRIGDWLARAGGGWTRRANSAVALGRSPGGTTDVGELEPLGAWYAERGLPLCLQLGTGQEALTAGLDARGWAASGHTAVRVAALAPLADREPDTRVRVERELTAEWLRGWPRAAEAPEIARQVLAGGPEVLFGYVPGADGGPPAAVGRCVVDGRWAGYAAMRVDPAYRRRGLAVALMTELARAALAAGASAAYLQVESDNAPARALYSRLGFADHHHYHYRTAPPAAA